MPLSQSYKLFSQALQSKGLLARYVSDRPPDPHYFYDLTNCECRLENVISSRFGLIPLTAVDNTDAPLSPSNIHSLARMLSVNGASYRYAGAGPALWRQEGTAAGAYTQISDALSGNTWTAEVYNAALASQPYLYLADQAAMLKDNGTFTFPQLWGLDPPVRPAITLPTAPTFTLLDDFNSAATSYTSNSGLTSLTSETFVSATVSGGSLTNPNTFPSVVDYTGMSGIGWLPWGLVNIGSQTDNWILSSTTSQDELLVVIGQPFTSGQSIIDHYIQGTLGSSTTGEIFRDLGAAIDLSSYATYGSIVLNIYVGTSIDITSIGITIDTSDGTFETGYYTATTTPGSSNVYASPYSGWVRVQISIPTFTAKGTAGVQGVTDWSNVRGWMISITCSDAGGTVGFESIYAIDGNSPDSEGGSNYYYAYTYYNAVSGAESNPSQLQPAVLSLEPLNQNVGVYALNPTDTQVTHIRFYRIGGTLSQYNMIGQVPVTAYGSGYTTFLDNVADETAELGQEMPTTNDPPVSASLLTPVNTTTETEVTTEGLSTIGVASTANMYVGQLATVDINQNQESVILTAVGTSTITAWFQLPHAAGVTITALTKPRQAMNLFAMAFGQAWLAGDPNNPHFLYYSSPNLPEAFPSANYVEVGSPDAPITAVIEFRGQLYVATTQTWWQVLVYPGSTPYPLPTGTTHGLITPFAWVLTESAIYYRSNDGVYAFSAGSSTYVSEPIMWLFTQSYQGPVDPPNPAQIAYERFAFYDNEIYWSYISTSDQRVRVIYDLVYSRFRDDDVQATAMLWERDTDNFICSEDDGMIYFDRTGNFDGLGYSGGVLTETPIGISMQTISIDFGYPKQDKVFNELTLDWDTGGQELTIELLLDELQTTQEIGTFSATGRTRTEIVLNSGLGFQSRTLSLRVSGDVTSAVYIYQFHVRAVLLAEPRQSFDTYKLDFGVPGYKYVKQGWFSYESPSEISINVYLDDNESAPAFTFSLPATPQRSEEPQFGIGERLPIRVRFPAFKARTWRFVGTADQDFRLYSTSWLEHKSVNSPGGYKPQALQEAV